MNEQPTQSNSRLASFARASWSIARAILHGPCGAFVVMAWVCGEMAKVFRRQTACLIAASAYLNDLRNVRMSASAALDRRADAERVAAERVGAALDRARTP